MSNNFRVFRVFRVFRGSLVPWLSVTSASRQTDLQSSCQLCLKRNNPDAS